RPDNRDFHLQALAVSTDGARIAAGGSWTFVAIHEADGKPFRRIPVGGFVTSLAFSPDAKSLAIGLEATVEVWDVSRPDSTAHPRPIEKPNATVFSPDGTLAIGTVNNVILWGTEGSEALLPTADSAVRMDWVGALVFARKGRVLYGVTRNPSPRPN